MTLRDEKYEDFETALRRNSGRQPEAGKPDQSGVSPQEMVVDTAQPTVKADVEERQAVEVRPMRYVLGIGIALAIVALALAWMLFR